MTVSTRTPEGWPHRCPICGTETPLDPSYPAGDSAGPSCGNLLWWFRDRINAQTGIAREVISWETTFRPDLIAESLDVVELVMEMEDEFDIRIPDDDYGDIKTIRDAILYVQEKRKTRLA